MKQDDIKDWKKEIQLQVDDAVYSVLSSITEDGERKDPKCCPHQATEKIMKLIESLITKARICHCPEHNKDLSDLLAEARQTERERIKKIISKASDLLEPMSAPNAIKAYKLLKKISSLGEQ
jgi:hypothetical protein